MAGDPPAVVPHPDWVIYKQSPALVLGFHGCDRSTAEDILCGRKRHLQHSSNEYDWLGSGIYFWEADPWRAWAFAKEVRDNPKLSRGKIDDPCVIGAVLDLGHCCNLLDYEVVGELQAAYSFIKEIFDLAGRQLPENLGGADRLKRNRDKVVIHHLHQLRHSANLPAYDSVRAAFIEGDEVYPGATFRRKNHIQIAVRQERCIKGYFRLPGF